MRQLWSLRLEVVLRWKLPRRNVVSEVESRRCFVIFLTLFLFGLWEEVGNVVGMTDGVHDFLTRGQFEPICTQRSCCRRLDRM